MLVCVNYALHVWSAPYIQSVLSNADNPSFPAANIVDGNLDEELVSHSPQKMQKIMNFNTNRKRTKLNFSAHHFQVSPWPASQKSVAGHR